LLRGFAGVAKLGDFILRTRQLVGNGKSSLLGGIARLTNTQNLFECLRQLRCRGLG
jgi:hypothetical protein